MVPENQGRVRRFGDVLSPNTPRSTQRSARKRVVALSSRSHAAQRKLTFATPTSGEETPSPPEPAPSPPAEEERPPTVEEERPPTAEEERPPTAEEERPPTAEESRAETPPPAGSPVAAGGPRRAGDGGGMAPRTPHGKGVDSISSLTLGRRPLATLGHCACAVRDVVRAGARNERWVARAGAVAAACGAAAVASREWALWLRYASWFVTLGVLSSVGIGVGLQTGALVLFPHVARLARALESCGVGVEYRLDSWRLAPLDLADCGREAPVPVASLFRATAVCGACAGLGAALGEVVPFFVARCARASGRDPLAALFGADGAPEALSPRSRKLVEVATRAGKG